MTPEWVCLYSFLLHCSHGFLLCRHSKRGSCSTKHSVEGWRSLSSLQETTLIRVYECHQRLTVSVFICACTARKSSLYLEWLGLGLWNLVLIFMYWWDNQSSVFLAGMPTVIVTNAIAQEYFDCQKFKVFSFLLLEVQDSVYLSLLWYLELGCRFQRGFSGYFISGMYCTSSWYGI